MYENLTGHGLPCSLSRRSWEKSVVKPMAPATVVKKFFETTFLFIYLFLFTLTILYFFVFVSVCFNLKVYALLRYIL